MKEFRRRPTRLFHRSTISAALVAVSLTFNGCSTPNAVNQESEVHTPTPAENPLLAEWSGPYAGVPPFDQIEIPHFKPALEAAMQNQLAAVDRIAQNPDAPTFDNTIAAFERSGRDLRRVQAVYNIWSGNLSSPEFQAVEREMGPKLASFSSRIYQNDDLFRRIESVYESRESAGLTPEQQRLTWLNYRNFVRAGARLDDNDKARVAEINRRLAELFTHFSQNVLADESDQMLVLDGPSDLAGLPQSSIDAAAEEAKRRDLEGKWVISNTRSSVDPFLTYSDRRDLREKAWRMFVSRGDMGGEHDNNDIITEILQLRAERAALLGYETHAHWRLEDSMAKEPERAVELMETVWKPAVARVRDEVAEMNEIAKAEGVDGGIQPWDYRYFAEKVRKEKYDFDSNELKPYLQLEKLREGMFWVAGELFGFEFAPVTDRISGRPAGIDVPVYHPDVRVWRVTDKTTGRHIGLWYFDPYARPGKRSGAWMNAYRRQERQDREVPTIVSNNSNFIKGRPGEPVLISWADAVTLFHEFGHAVHGLASDVTYASLSGTLVPRDYVEFPSQLLEHWLSTPEVLRRFALHYETGEPIPQRLVDQVERADRFKQGFDTVEFLGSAIVDMKLHLEKEHPIDPDTFERETLAELGMPDEIVMRHRTPHFLHVFSGDSYSAGYYSYLWADVLTADAYEAFTEAGGPYDREVVRRLREHVLSAGNTIDPAEGYRRFRGRDPEIGALMRKRGFTE